MSTSKRGKRFELLAGCVVVVVVGISVWVMREHIRFWWQFEALGNNERGYPEYRHRQTGIVMVKLPCGTFMMGSPETEEGREDGEGPVHEVTLSPFLIAKYEVSQEEWMKVMGENPSELKGDELPVEGVSWEDCQQFCKKADLKLPTEAQWEYACRAGKGGLYAGTGKLDDMGWYDENSGGTWHLVGEKAPNDFGLHDMHGNLFEWCEDVFDEKFYSKTEASKHDPICKSGSGDRVMRGGCWRDTAHCRSACRGRDHPSFRSGGMGLRPSRSVTFE